MFIAVRNILPTLSRLPIVVTEVEFLALKVKLILLVRHAFLYSPCDEFHNLYASPVFNNEREITEGSINNLKY